MIQFPLLRIIILKLWGNILNEGLNQHIITIHERCLIVVGIAGGCFWSQVSDHMAGHYPKPFHGILCLMMDSVFSG